MVTAWQGLSDMLPTTRGQPPASVHSKDLPSSTLCPHLQPCTSQTPSTPYLSHSVCLGRVGTFNPSIRLHPADVQSRRGRADVAALFVAADVRLDMDTRMAAVCRPPSGKDQTNKTCRSKLSSTCPPPIHHLSSNCPLPIRDLSSSCPLL